MLIKRISKLFLTSAITAVLSISSTAAAATEWTTVTVWPESNYHVKALRQFAAGVARVTNGEVKMVVHSGGSLGLKGPELLSAVRDGIVQVADMLMTQQVGQAPLLGLESVPYLTRNYQELAQLQKIALPYYQKIAEQNNQKFLYFLPWPGQGLFSKSPSNTIEGFKNIKVRTVDKNGTDFFKALGSAPIQMPWSEVVPALASGAIDGVTTSSPSGADGKFWEFLKHFNRLNWQSASQAISVNRDAWNKISPKNQKAIEALAAELQPKFWVMAAEQDQQALELLKKNNMQVIEPDAALVAALAKAAEPLWVDFMKRVGPDAQKIIKEYRQVSGR